VNNEHVSQKEVTAMLLPGPLEITVWVAIWIAGPLLLVLIGLLLELRRR